MSKHIHIYIVGHSRNYSLLNPELGNHFSEPCIPFMTTFREKGGWGQDHSGDFVQECGILNVLQLVVEIPQFCT